MEGNQWNNENVIKFLEYIRVKPCLWNPNHEYYNNNKYKNNAWQSIKVWLPFVTTVEDMKKKKNYLFSYYRNQLIKIEDSMVARTGDIYTCNWFAFQIMDDFLRDVYEHRLEFVAYSDEEREENDEGCPRYSNPFDSDGEGQSTPPKKRTNKSKASKPKASRTPKVKKQSEFSESERGPATSGSTRSLFSAEFPDGFTRKRKRLIHNSSEVPKARRTPKVKKQPEFSKSDSDTVSESVSESDSESDSESERGPATSEEENYETIRAPTLKSYLQQRRKASGYTYQSDPTKRGGYYIEVRISNYHELESVPAESRRKHSLISFKTAVSDNSATWKAATQLVAMVKKDFRNTRPILYPPK